MQQAFAAASASGLGWEGLFVHCTQHVFQAVSECVKPPVVEVLTRSYSPWDDRTSENRTDTSNNQITQIRHQSTCPIPPFATSEFTCSAINMCQSCLLE